MRLLHRLAVASCVGSLGLALGALSGCGGGVSSEPGKSIGVYNEDPNAPLKGITIENEADHMKTLKKATKVAPTKSLGPALPGQNNP